MNKLRLSLAGTVLGIGLMLITSSPHKTLLAHSPEKITLTGSTPCDPFIKSVLRIPESVNCEFQKWNIIFYQDDKGTNSFESNILYGESQPNTNGFRGGGTKLSVKGTYKVTQPLTVGSTRGTIYELNSEGLALPMYLLRIDDNLFHFLDREKKLLVGNGGYSYSLYRVE